VEIVENTAYFIELRVRFSAPQVMEQNPSRSFFFAFGAGDYNILYR